MEKRCGSEFNKTKPSKQEIVYLEQKATNVWGSFKITWQLIASLCRYIQVH